MTLRAAFRLAFVGAAIAATAHILANGLAYREYTLLGTSLLDDGWVTAGGVLMMLCGLYKFFAGGISD
jgi:hypothetical protein